MRRSGARVAGLLAALLLAVGGCGSDSETPSAPARPAETFDELPPLAAGWEPYRNPAGGFAFGLPPGWQARDEGTVTVIRSFDRLVSVVVDPDRTSEALEQPLGSLVEQVLAGLPDYEADLGRVDPRPFPHRYDAVAIDAEGTSPSTGVGQRLELIAIRRPRLAAFIVSIEANADARSAPAAEVARAMVGTLRSRPVGPSL